MNFETPKTKRFVWLRGLIVALSIAPIPFALFYDSFARTHLSQCPFQARFGFPSPSCGLTRSIIALLRGDFVEAFSYHAFGPLIVATGIVIALHSGLELFSKRSISTFYTRLSFQITALVGTLFLSFIYYALRIYLRYFNANYPSWIFESSFGQWLVWGARTI